MRIAAILALDSGGNWVYEFRYRPIAKFINDEQRQHLAPSALTNSKQTVDPVGRCVTSVMIEQEIVSPTEPKYEDVATISGTFDEETVTGFTRIEMVGTGAADPVA
ncbi:hypothetical protein G6L63_01450 [Agrobacterium vitis]|uniref:Uncharacterized protein n=1 Tax=Agrobacterium vitis TaxID=373 RepID=A0A7J4X668_AGRVI|nr:hypothetical protein [Agrobacterium vitis]KAA3528341.1 hypothetical protein DXT89_09980 [Agrobacterium vitis]MVA31067.1 hypothetical protein [Agrobacterium vitis]NOJ35644.1 hypothetical protein [Agrobacterium vitis]NSZ46587.1 hypothetical protein [Agrobacterium vitis]UJL74493.1 hypothetical protein AVCG412_17815 [Agrobacterium vitis]